jgi:hypothetical protein
MPARAWFAINGDRAAAEMRGGRRLRRKSRRRLKAGRSGKSATALSSLFRNIFSENPK